MKFDVYCDEAFPDSFTSKNPTVKYLMIGSLWLPHTLRIDIKNAIKNLKKQHSVGGEIKWHKVSNNKMSFYKSLIDLFVANGDDLRFRCIAVDHTQVDMNYHDDDCELGFYKFYYQLLHHWILCNNEYNIYCDRKTSRYKNRLSTLGKCLDKSNLFANINHIESVSSQENLLIQFSDLLLGCASARINNTVQQGSARDILTSYLEEKLNKKLESTVRSERKFNIFKINLSGGW